MLIAGEFVRLFLVLILVLGFGGYAAAQEPAADIRILVDVSGSMERTDPDNLRQPALRLAADLLPAETRAGILAFAGDVETLTAADAVSEEWRERARDAAGDIHSRGAYTDIGAALDAAASDWIDDDTEASDDAARHIVLFTDGQVDVSGSGDQPEDRRERQRILESLAPAYRDQGIHVHTVGLSEAVDQELMAEVARITGGQNTATRDADELERLFLRLVESIAPRDALPLDGNRFQVDDSVSELTVVAFRESDDSEVQLQRPDGSQLSEEDAGDELRWRSEPNHALITLDDPEAGEWQLLGAEDPDNRVMVVTDLRLAVDELPAYALAGEALTVSARITEQDESITRDDFLDLTTFTFAAGEDDPNELTRTDDGAVHKADYPLQEPGDRTITVRAASDTFERVQRQRIAVLEQPLTLKRTRLPDQDEDTDAPKRRLRIRPASDAVDAADFGVELHLEDSDGRTQVLRFPEPDNAQGWNIQLDTLNPELGFSVAARAVGTMPSGRDVETTLERFELPAEETEEETPETERNWLVIGAFLVAFNLILFAVIGLGMWLFQQRRTEPPALDDTTPSGDSAEEEPS